MGSFEGDNGEKLIKEKGVLDLAGQAEIFFCECIEKSVTNKYWLTLKQKLTTAKEKIRPKRRIGETCFTSMAMIESKLFSNNLKI